MRVGWVLRGYGLDRESRHQALPVLTFDVRFSTSEGVEILKA
jgi:hypothetical protein